MRRCDLCQLLTPWYDLSCYSSHFLTSCRNYCLIIEELLSVATGVIITEVTHLSDIGLIQRTAVVTSMCEREMTKSYRAFDSYPDIDLSLLPENRAELKNFYSRPQMCTKCKPPKWKVGAHNGEELESRAG